LSFTSIKISHVQADWLGADSVMHKNGSGMEPQWIYLNSEFLPHWLHADARPMVAQGAEMGAWMVSRHFAWQQRDGSKEMDA